MSVAITVNSDSHTEPLAREMRWKCLHLIKWQHSLQSPSWYHRGPNDTVKTTFFSGGLPSWVQQYSDVDHCTFVKILPAVTSTHLKHLKLCPIYSFTFSFANMDPWAFTPKHLLNHFKPSFHVTMSTCTHYERRILSIERYVLWISIDCRSTQFSLNTFHSILDRKTIPLTGCITSAWHNVSLVPLWRLLLQSKLERMIFASTVSL